MVCCILNPPLALVSWGSSSNGWATWNLRPWVPLEQNDSQDVIWTEPSYSAKKFLSILVIPCEGLAATERQSWLYRIIGLYWEKQTWLRREHCQWKLQKSGSLGIVHTFNSSILDIEIRGRWVSVSSQASLQVPAYIASSRPGRATRTYCLKRPKNKKNYLCLPAIF